MKEIIIEGMNSKDAFKYENAFHWFSSQERLAKILTQFDLYRRCADLPGYVAEFGVFKGNSLIRLASFRNILEAPHSRTIYGFDAFDDFPTEGINDKPDKEFISRFLQETDWVTYRSSTSMPIHNGQVDGEPVSPTLILESVLYLKGLVNVKLIAGDIRETLPAFLKSHPEIRFNFVHIDVDVYEPTKYVLERVWPLIVRGGIVMLDDYTRVGGASKAVDEFLADHPGLEIHKLRWCHTCSFITKSV